MVAGAGFEPTTFGLQVKTLFERVFTCNHNLSELIRILCLQIFQSNQPCQKFLSFTTNYQNFCNFFVTGYKLKIPPFYNNNKPPYEGKYKKDTVLKS